MTSRPWGVHAIHDIYSDGVRSQIEGTSYARAVAEPYTGNRVVAAWWVLTGRAFALKWPKAGDLENALRVPLWDRRAKTA